MYTYLQCNIPGLSLLIEGENNRVALGEPIKGIIEFNTSETDVTINKLNISLMGVREKRRALKLDRFNVNHSVEIEPNSLLKFPFRMMIDQSKFEPTMTLELDVRIKTSIGEFESSSSFLHVLSEEID
ncbi:MAG TPA: sporulation protein [Aliicoccus persicus]|uniref:Sporulation protein n=1 Tax=Aliicoccus persicus TaxID=930138 RepID=A0A921B739_9STAP|nr:sporulation protein [Aliicoccus persicus]